MPYKISVIGAGIAGTHALGSLAAAGRTDLEISVFDGTPNAGRGMPFVNDHPSLLLNQPVGRIGLQGAQESFRDWLKRERPEMGSATYARRSDLGAYVQAWFQTFLAELGGKFVRRSVTDLKLLDDGFRLYDQNNSLGSFDAVLICAGQFPYKDPLGLGDSVNWVANPYPLSAWKARLKSAGRLAILGSGLATVDLLRYLKAEEYPGKIIVLSQTGKFPSVRGDEKPIASPAMDRAVGKGKPTLEELVSAYQADLGDLRDELPRLFPEEVKNQAWLMRNQLQEPAKMGKLQQLVLKYYPRYDALWQALPLSDQQAFYKAYMGDFLLLQGPMPPESAALVAEMLESGKVKVYPEAQLLSDGKKLRLETPEGGLSVDLLVNATGPALAPEDGGYATPMSGLLQNLLDSRILQAETLGGILVQLPQFSVVSQRYGVIRRLKLHGQAIGPLHFANNSIEKIGEGVALSIKDLLEDLS